MRKELEALRRFRDNSKVDCQTDYYLSTQYIDDCEIVERALKNYQYLKEQNEYLRDCLTHLDEAYSDMWYACEALIENSNYALMFVDDVYCLVDTKDNKFKVLDTYEINDSGCIVSNTVQNKLKVLEIITKKNVQIKALKFWNETYKGKLHYQNYLAILEDCDLGDKLTEEEFNLIAEVILWVIN